MSDGGAQFHRIPAIWDATNSTIYSQPELWHYEAGTSNAKDIWANENKTGALAQPFVAGTDGEWSFYADGDYKFVVFENGEGPGGTPIKTWDNVKVTSDTATMWEGNQGTSAPSATVNNLGHMFVELEATTNDFEKLMINHGTGAGGAGPVFKTLIEELNGIRLYDDILLKGPIIDVRAYGALGDDSTDNATAIQTAANAIPATGGALYFPKGTYQSTTDIDIQNKPIRIFGDGKGISVIKWVTGTDYGIDYDTTTSTHAFIVHDISLHTTVAGAGDAINAAWTSADFVRQKCILYNVEIAPAIGSESTAYWTRGIYISNSPNSYLNNVSLQGKLNNITDMTHGIYLTNSCLRSRILNCRAWYIDKSILLDSGANGAIISNLDANYVNYGVHLNYASARTNNQIDNCKIEAFKYGVRCIKVLDSELNSNRITKYPDSTEDFWGIEIDIDSNSNQIKGNSIKETGTSGTDIGIVITGDNNLIANNYVEDQDTGINCLAASSKNLVVNNIAINNTTNYTDGSSTNDNIWKDNYLDGSQTIASASTITIPATGEVFELTGTTTVDRIAATWIGRKVTLYKKFSDGDTCQITDSVDANPTSIRLVANKSMTATDTLDLVYGADGYWNGRADRNNG